MEVLHRPRLQMRRAVQGVGQGVGMGLQTHLLALHAHARLRDAVRVGQQRVEAALAPAHRVDEVLRVGVQHLHKPAVGRCQMQCRDAAACGRHQAGAGGASVQVDDIAHGFGGKQPVFLWALRIAAAATRKERIS